ncbi:VanZ family protein [Mesobacillus foraminis]|uniref:VanZ family protein n=1 Tax=Mesobacillus foraminis TaxID=279826 RepID=UPI00399F4296
MEDSIMFTIHSWPILVTAFSIFLLYLFFGTKYRAGQNFVLITFAVYLSAVIHLVFFPIEVNIGKYANLTPWYKTINFIPILTIDLTTFVLNILMLLPFGMYLPLIFGKADSVKTIMKKGLLFSFTLETLQLIIRITLGSGRSTDVNDLIANTIGAGIGYLIFRKMYKIKALKSILSKLMVKEKKLEYQG